MVPFAAAALGALVLKAERPRLFIEAADLPRLRDAWSSPSRARASAELFRYCMNRLEDSPGEWSGSAWPLEPARSLAIVALMEGTRAFDDSPGGRMAAKALSLALSLSSAEPGNPAEMLAMAVVYDWLYDLIELEDRARLRAALKRHIKHHLARAGSAYAARAALLACADELPRGRELLARSGGGSVERALFGGLRPAESSPLASSMVATGLTARLVRPHPTSAERALIRFSAFEGNEEARWALALLGEPEEPWMRVFEFVWPAEEGGFPPVPCASSPLPPRAVARESWERDALVASAGPDGGGVYRGQAGMEFFRGRARSARAGCAGIFSYIRAETALGAFEAVILRGGGALVRLRRRRGVRELSFRARGEMAPELIWPKGTIARTGGGVRVSSSKSAEFVFAVPAGTKARRGAGFYCLGNAGVAFADGRRSFALDLAGEEMKRILLCGLEEGDYRLRAGVRTESASAGAAGVIELELSGGEDQLRVRKEGG